MVLGRVDGVGTNDIGLQLGEVGNVTGAAIDVGEGVGVVVAAGALTGDILLVGNTANVELGAVVAVEEFGALLISL